MQRTVFIYRDERQVYIGRLCAGQFFLGFFCSFLQSLVSHIVFSQIYAVFLGEAVCHEVEQCFVEVIAAQLVVAVGSQYFEYAVAQFQDGYIECTATQVIYQDLVLFFIFIKTVCQGSCRRLVDDSLNVKPCDLACVFCCLLLAVCKVCRYCDNSFRYLFSQIAFCISLKLCQDHSGDVLRRVFLAVDFYCMICTHVSLDGCNGSVRIGDCLSLGSFSNQSFSVLCESHNGWCGSVSFCVSDNDRFSTFQYCYARVCSS